MSRPGTPDEGRALKRMRARQGLRARGKQEGVLPRGECDNARVSRSVSRETCIESCCSTRGLLLCPYPNVSFQASVGVWRFAQQSSSSGPLALCRSSNSGDDSRTNARRVRHMFALAMPCRLCNLLIFQSNPYLRLIGLPNAMFMGMALIILIAALALSMALGWGAALVVLSVLLRILRVHSRQSISGQWRGASTKSVLVEENLRVRPLIQGLRQGGLADGSSGSGAAPWHIPHFQSASAAAQLTERT